MAHIYFTMCTTSLRMRWQDPRPPDGSPRVRQAHNTPPPPHVISPSQDLRYLVYLPRYVRTAYRVPRVGTVYRVWMADRVHAWRLHFTPPPLFYTQAFISLSTRFQAWQGGKNDVSLLFFSDTCSPCGGDAPNQPVRKTSSRAIGCCTLTELGRSCAQAYIGQQDWGRDGIFGRKHK
ncbi:hypothetical protein LY78DRAFT_457033 [Colletotrichum sublineola]|nr:hypothetical protein LY78DRAFT_457033 [Colletotrichum sublineola]